MVEFEQKWLYSGKVVVFLARVIVFGEKWLYSGKSGCIRGQNGFIWPKWL